jgi:hypothetical protein
MKLFMAEIDLQDKKTQVIIFVFLIIMGALSYILFFEEAKPYTQVVKHINTPVEKVQKAELPKKKEIIKEKKRVEKKKIVEYLEEKEEIIKKEITVEEKQNVLFRTNSISHMHEVRVISDILIEKDETLSYDFTAVQGNVINPDNVDGRFSISIRSDYLEYLSDIYIEITDKISKTKSKCDASFLIGINKNDFYQFNFDNGTCYITDSRTESEFSVKMKKQIKPIHKMSEEEFLKLPKETQEIIQERIKALTKT